MTDTIVSKVDSYTNLVEVIYLINQLREASRQVRGNANAIGFTLWGEFGMAVLLFIPGWIIWGLSDLFESDLIAEVGSLLTYFCMIAVPFGIAARKRGFRFAELAGRGTPRFGAYLSTIFLCCGLSSVASFLAMYLEMFLNSYGFSDASEPYTMPFGILALFVQFISIVLLPPVVEELCFRGYFQKEAMRSAGTVGGVLVSALLFCGVHLSVTAIPLALGFGLLAGFLREKYDSIWPCVAGHITVNGIYFIFNLFIYDATFQQQLFLSDILNIACLVLGAFGVLLLFAQDRFEWESFVSFVRPSLWGSGATFWGYITCVPLLLAAVWIFIQTAWNLLPI